MIEVIQSKVISTGTLKSMMNQKHLNVMFVGNYSAQNQYLKFIIELIQEKNLLLVKNVIESLL